MTLVIAGERAIREVSPDASAALRGLRASTKAARGTGTHSVEAETDFAAQGMVLTDRDLAVRMDRV
jgi:hypothetical protein